MKMFDLHCDTITGLAEHNASLRENEMHIDLQKLRKGGTLAQCFAIFVHQKWCEVCLLTLPGCLDCLYYREQRRSCIHPAKRKRKEDLPHEKAKRPI